jgi:16S rRNA (guanine966-N2)-methyltransferase
VIVSRLPRCHESAVRIIAGKAGRLAIKVPGAVARPTTDFVRQAIFSILGEKNDDARVLDLYAGSGAIGLEALSRGAASCVFVDDHRQAIKVIGENLLKSRLEGARVVKSAALPFLKSDQAHYDLIFADPPYVKYPGDHDHVLELLDKGNLQSRLAPEGWFIAEVSSSYRTPEAKGWRLVDRREYGSSAILLYAPAPAA